VVDWLQRQSTAHRPPAPTPAPPPTDPNPTPEAEPAAPPRPMGMPAAPWAQAVAAAAAGDVHMLAQQLTDAQAALRDAREDHARTTARAQADALHHLLVQTQQRRAQRPPSATDLVAAVRPTAQPFGPGQHVTAARLDGAWFLNGVRTDAIDHPVDGPSIAQTAQGPLALSGSGAHLLATLPEGGLVTFTLPESVTPPAETPAAVPAPATSDPPVRSTPTSETTAPRDAAAVVTAPERPAVAETPPPHTASDRVPPPWKRGGA